MVERYPTMLPVCEVEAMTNIKINQNISVITLIKIKISVIKKIYWFKIKINQNISVITFYTSHKTIYKLDFGEHYSKKLLLQENRSHETIDLHSLLDHI